MKRYVFLLSIVLCYSCAKDNDDQFTDVPNETGVVSNDTIVAGVNLGDYFNINFDNLPNYSNPDYPIHYTNAVVNNTNTPNDNSTTDIGATLGRVLFFDEQLSVNNTISCASCHQQGIAFTDNNQFSTGFDGGLTGAHSMRLVNAQFYEGESFFWDKRASTLEIQTTQPIINSVEMGFDDSNGGIPALIAKMNDIPYYPALFQLAFGDTTITEDRMQRAMAQYIRSMVSYNSKFDDAYSANFDASEPENGINEDFPEFTAQENQGKRLFLTARNAGGANCATCHQPPTFALDGNSRSIGLDAGETTIFKVHSLKNVATSSHFMHDGRFTTLNQVISHYNNGIENGPSLDNRLRQGGNPVRLGLTPAEQNAIVAFLETLTDDVVTEDIKFTNPFVD